MGIPRPSPAPDAAAVDAAGSREHRPLWLRCHPELLSRRFEGMYSASDRCARLLLPHPDAVRVGNGRTVFR